MEDKFANHTYNPEIRFRGYTDDWEQRKLGEISDSYSGGTPTAGKSEYYRGDIPFIRSAEVNSDSTELFLTDEGLKNSSAKMVNKGDILYALYGATSGETGLARLDGAINQAILDIKPHENYDATFIMQWLRKSKENIIGTYLQGGQGNLSGSIVTSLMIDCPNHEEQKLIGEYFRDLDHLITLHQRKCDTLKNLKASMLTKMFPKEGESMPEIRFKGFTDSWEQRKVQDVADRFDNLRIPVAANLRVHGKTPYYGANGIQDYVDGFTHDGEFVLVAEDGANDLKNYPVKCVNGRVWVNNHAHVLQGKARIADNSFLAFAISQSDIESLLVGGGRAKLNAETLMSIEFRLPCLQEQYQIGEYLSQLDNLITLHQHKLDKLKNIKKSMLDKMFV